MNEGNILQAEVNKTFRRDIEELTKRVKTLEDRREKSELEQVNKFHELEMVFSKVLDSKLDPVIRNYETLEARVHRLEDRPKDTSLKFMLWMLGGMGSIIIALIIALITSVIT